MTPHTEARAHQPVNLDLFADHQPDPTASGDGAAYHHDVDTCPEPAAPVAAPTPDDPLTDEEREALARCEEEIARYEEVAFDAGRALRTINEGRLYRERHGTFEEYVASAWSFTDSRAYYLIRAVDVVDDLIAAGVADLPKCEAHARPLSRLTPDDRVTVWEMLLDQYGSPEALTMSKVRGVVDGLFPRKPDGEEASNGEPKSLGDDVESGEESLGAPARASALALYQSADQRTGVHGLTLGAEELDRLEDEKTTNPALDTGRSAVREHEGLLVALDASAVANPDAALAELPGRLVVPYGDGLELPKLSERRTEAAAFVAAKLDDATDLTWPVLVPDPWEAPETWSLPASQGDGPFRAVYYPDRLSAPASRPKRAPADHEVTVLVAPGVDPLHPAVPDRVARAIVEAAAADPARRYLALTAHPERAAALGGALNIFVAVEVVGTAAAVDAAVARLWTAPSPRALVVRDLAEPVEPDALRGVDWVLVRGPKTTQAAYDAVRTALGPSQALDVGRNIRARHTGCPPLPEPRPEPEGAPAEGARGTADRASQPRPAPSPGRLQAAPRPSTTA